MPEIAGWVLAGTAALSAFSLLGILYALLGIMSSVQEIEGWVHGDQVKKKVDEMVADGLVVTEKGKKWQGEQDDG